MLPLQAKRLGQKRLVEGEAGHVELLLRWGENKVFCSDQNALPCVILVMNIMSYCYCYLYSQSYFNRIVRVLVFNRSAEFLFRVLDTTFCPSQGLLSAGNDWLRGLQ